MNVRVRLSCFRHITVLHTFSGFVLQTFPLLLMRCAFWLPACHSLLCENAYFAVKTLVRLRPVWMTNHPPSVLWHCWLGHQTCKKPSVV